MLQKSSWNKFGINNFHSKGTKDGLLIVIILQDLFVSEGRANGSFWSLTWWHVLTINIDMRINLNQWMFTVGGPVGMMCSSHLSLFHEAHAHFSLATRLDLITKGYKCSTLEVFSVFVGTLFPFDVDNPWKVLRLLSVVFLYNQIFSPTPTWCMRNNRKCHRNFLMGTRKVCG